MEHVKPPAWCGLCGTHHAAAQRCPRQLEASGPERVVWRVAVETPQGLRGIGVMLAACGARFRARVLTFPNVLWVAPGGRETIKFIARHEDEARQRAIDFVRAHCLMKGHVMRDEIAPAGDVKRRVTVGIPPPPRYQRRLPLRFGRSRPTIPAVTGNLSEAGLFVVTHAPLAGGELLGLALELEHCKVPLRGAVSWARRDAPLGAECGMGLSLINPPEVYVRYVKALA